ncbi:MAG: hypothetical protein IPM03_15075 [Sulfuritalea sp.]|nr:hypothetical protein [Sulfuritalea sp.]
MHYSVKDKLKAKVRASKALVFLRADFAHLGCGRQISRALSELESERILVRAGYGVYTRPVAGVPVDQLVAGVKARLGRRVNRLVTFGETTVQLGLRSKGRQNAQSLLDSLKLEMAQAVLEEVDMATLRRRSLENLERWRENGSWCSAFAEWQELMASGSDAEVVAAMTGSDETANRLRQSAPYVGLLRTTMLEAIREASCFYETHGYYVDPVDSRTAVLPRDWKSRLVNVSSPGTNGVTGLCLDPHDLFISKVAAWREKDIEFAKVMIGHGMVEKDRLLVLASKVPNPEDDLDRAARIIKRIERLCADREPPQ